MQKFLAKRLVFSSAFSLVLQKMDCWDYLQTFIKKNIQESLNKFYK